MVYSIFPLVLLAIIVAVVVFVGIGGRTGGILGSLKELVLNQVIDEEQAEKIKAYYQSKKESSNLAMIILSVVGVILVGLGIILIVAHNWYQIPKFIKLIISFFILISAQFIFIFNIYKKKTSLLAIEGSSVFLALMTAAVIALIGQIYHMPGSFESFLFTWMLLILPLPYIYGSSITCILYLIGITIWLCVSEIGLFGYDVRINTIMYLFMLPFTLNFISKNKFTIRERFVELILFITMIACLLRLTISDNNIINPMLLVNSIIVVLFFVSVHMKKLNLYLTKIISKLVILGQMLVIVITEYSDYVGSNKIILSKDVFSNVVAFLILLVAMFAFYYFARKKDYENFLFTIPPILLIFGDYTNLSDYIGLGQSTFYFANIYLIIVAVILILKSNATNNLLKLNGGLLITIILVLKWFFDMGSGIIERAAGFIISGAVLIILNMIMLKKKKGVIADETVDDEN